MENKSGVFDILKYVSGTCQNYVLKKLSNRICSRNDSNARSKGTSQGMFDKLKRVFGNAATGASVLQAFYSASQVP